MNAKLTNRTKSFPYHDSIKTKHIHETFSFSLFTGLTYIRTYKHTHKTGLYV